MDIFQGIKSESPSVNCIPALSIFLFVTKNISTIRTKCILNSQSANIITTTKNKKLRRRIPRRSKFTTKNTPTNQIKKRHRGKRHHRDAKRKEKFSNQSTSGVVRKMFKFPLNPFLCSNNFLYVNEL